MRRVASVMIIVAPARERGLKSDYYLKLFERENRRSREGAWIEIVLFFSSCALRATVAPARERGLKLFVALQP